MDRPQSDVVVGMIVKFNCVYPQLAHAAAVHVVVELHAYRADIVEPGCSDPEMSALVQLPGFTYILAPRQ